VEDDPGEDRCAGSARIAAVAKLIILSVVIACFAIPIMLSTGAKPRQALRKAQWSIFAFVIFWAYMCTHWYPLMVELK
jgi:hypothetical protein